eukprot:3293373-Prymnesium_polylepis.1
MSRSETSARVTFRTCFLDPDLKQVRNVTWAENKSGSTQNLLLRSSSATASSALPTRENSKKSLYSQHTDILHIHR